MTTFRIYCNSILLCAAVLVLFTSTAAGHAVHSHSEEPQAPLNSQAHQKLSVDELIQQYSLLGDDALLEEAQRQLPMKEQFRSVQQLLQAAWLAQAEHDFERARLLVQQILHRQPNNGQAWLLEAAIADVVGDHLAARRACARVLLSVSPDAAVICFASLADTEQQKVASHGRLSNIPKPSGDSRLTAWRYSVQAELARDLGNTLEAEALFRRAIAIFPAIQLRSALMDLYLQQERYADVLAIGAERASVPAIAVRRLLAKKGLGKDVHLEVAQLNVRFRGWLEEQDYRHAREMAMFYLDIQPQVDLAFKIAKENARLQRESEDLVLLNRAWEQHRAAKGI